METCNIDWGVFDNCVKTLITPSTSPETIEKEGSKSTKDNDIKCSCGETHFVCVEGQYCCMSCGSISQNIHIHAPEVNFSDNSSSSSSRKSTSRMGMPTNPLLPNSSLGSTISSKGYQTKSIQKICNYHKWNSMPYKERSLWNVYSVWLHLFRRGTLEIERLYETGYCKSVQYFRSNNWKML